MTSGWLDSARRVGLLQVAAELGVEVRRRALARCPACGAESGVKVVGEGRWRCFHCDVGGDAVDLVAAAVHGRKLDRAGSEAVRDWYAARGWCEAPRDREIRRVEPRPAPERVEAHVEGPPPQDEVYALGRACRPVTEDAEVSAWLARRLGADAPRRVAAGRLVVALPWRALGPPWAVYGGRRWAEIGYRAVVPVYDAGGVARSVRARCVGTPPERAPKALPPRGYSVRGLVMASQVGRAMLRGEAWPARVVVAEGEPQWLAACLEWPDRAVLGIVAGSWSAEIAARVPVGAEVLVVTDHGDVRGAGDRYAAQIEGTLAGRRVARLGVAVG